MALRAAAILTIRAAAAMTPAGREAVAAWLRRQASLLVQEGPEYSTRYTARYLYDAPPPDGDQEAPH